MKKSRLGFTLIELLIVIVIMGILSVVFLPTLLSAPKKARDAVRTSSVDALMQTVQSYLLDKNTPPTKADFASYFPNNQIPKDPLSTVQNPDGYRYYINGTNKCFMIGAKLELSDKGNSNQVVVDGGGDAAGPLNNIDCTGTPAKSATQTDNIYYNQYSKY